MKKKLAKNTLESDWGEFLERNLFLIDSKYVKTIPELNVVLAGARKVDFGLIDSQGYLDMFEIKKPQTELIAPKQDRGNYYWHPNATMALTQAEKYLYYAESRRKILEEDIERQKRHKVNVIKPRAYIIMGHTKQLDTKEKQEDFRILRSSLKNLEIILYDELLERLKNQKNKVFE
ncbi:Shedu immune nuclease family protein [Terrimonas pollutisoli]|uniref:Shedu immune nuclease family protein n=1 Tax=Terrimonas pollutisoli TaxID=3034147 RepID=UPI0023EB798C|nr:Shedu immune nuclease family protein [Terrimonas sp. H1YJ31]